MKHIRRKSSSTEVKMILAMLSISVITSHNRIAKKDSAVA
jgi:hypothetical protein